MTDFDPEEFGRAVADAIRETVAPLQKRIEELESQRVEKCDAQRKSIAARVSALLGTQIEIDA